VVMTAAVIEELSGLGHTRTCCRRAEVATLLRFVGAVHVVAGQVVLSAEVDGAGVAGRLRKAIRETFGYPSDVRVLPTAVGRSSRARYQVRVLTDGAALGRQTGLLDPRGRPIRGLPAHVVAGRVCDAEAVWRAAFLARGSLTDRGGFPALEVSCPTPEAAMALVGAARRLGITAKGTRGARQGPRPHPRPRGNRGAADPHRRPPHPGQLGGTQDAPHAGTRQHPPATSLR